MFDKSLDFAYLKRVVSIEQVLAHRGLLAALRPRGCQLVGPCPVHGGDNPRAFVLDRNKALWHCFTACGGGGDVVELVRRLDHSGYREVARYLAGIKGRAPPSLPPPPAPVSAPFVPFTARLHLDHHHTLLHGKGIHPDTARGFEVGGWYGGGILAGCVAIRLTDSRGHPLGYAGRRLCPDAARIRGKWVFPPRLPKSKLLYGLFQARNSLQNGLAVVECPWGVLRLHQVGIPAVALLGTRLSPWQREILRNVPRVVLMMDGDPAGRRAAQAIQRVLGACTQTTRVDLPDGLDPDDQTDQQLSEMLRSLLPS